MGARRPMCGLIPGLTEAAGQRRRRGSLCCSDILLAGLTSAASNWFIKPGIAPIRLFCRELLIRTECPIFSVNILVYQ